MKPQLNVRATPVCMDLIKLEHKSIDGCASDGEALESMIFRASTSMKQTLLPVKGILAFTDQPDLPPTVIDAQVNVLVRQSQTRRNLSN